MKKIDSFSRRVTRALGHPENLWTRQLGQCKYLPLGEFPAQSPSNKQVLDTQKMIGADFEVRQGFHVATAYKTLMTLILRHVHTAFKLSPLMMRKTDYQFNVQLLRGVYPADSASSDQPMRSSVELDFSNSEMVLQRYLASSVPTLIRPEVTQDQYSCAVVMDHRRPEIHGALIVPLDIWQDLTLAIDLATGYFPGSLTLGIRAERPQMVLDMLDD